MEIPQERTRYDSGKRRQSQRYGKERGVRINIPAAVLREAGIDPHGPPPEYNLWAPSRDGKPQRSVMVRLYLPS